MRVIAPPQFAEERAHRSAGTSDSTPDIGRRNLAEVEVRRQARRAFLRRQIAGFVIVRGVIDKLIDAAPRAVLARRPVLEARCPIGLGRQQPPVFKGIALGPGGGRRNVSRTIERIGRRHLLIQCAPERRVDLVRRAAAAGDRARGRKVIAVMADQIEPFRDGALRIAPPRLVMTDGVNAPCPHLLGELRQFLVALPAPQDQP